MPSRSSKKTAKKKQRGRGKKKRDRRPRQLRDQPKLEGKTEPISLYPLSFDEAMRRLVNRRA